ncbi:MAG: alpha/beta hydrolase [Actinomycetota bacterium]|nr:alpha/beta hydrolase [Actinomycetota bacterium]
MRRLRRARVTAAAAVVALIVGGCASPSAPRASDGRPPGTTATPTTTSPPGTAEVPVRPVSWHDCSSEEGPGGYQCATVMVPLDPSHPGPATLPLAIDRRPASGPSAGVLLVNPGGPGASGVDELPTIVGMLNPDLTSHFDIVGFDPPGVGHSEPVTCLDNTAFGQYLHLDPSPPGPAGLASIVTADRQFAAGCAARSHAVLGHVSTVDAARDMDLIRRALGENKLNYLGFSYGTLLGATYAQLFGANVRAMVLDGAVDPSQGVLAQLQAQAASFDSQFRQLAASCAGAASCPWHGGPAGGAARGGTAGSGAGGLLAAFGALEDLVRQHPIPVGDRTVGPSELLYGTAAGLYSTQSWPLIESALADAENGDGTLMLAAYDSYVQRSPDGTYSNSLEAQAAVSCLDDPAPTTAAITANVAAFEAAAPVFGLPVLYGELQCAEWPVPATGAPHVITAPHAPTVVVVGSTGDPATPYAGAQRLAGELTHGILLTRDGGGHTGYGASSCIRQSVDQYLISLAQPAPATTCPSDSSG